MRYCKDCGMQLINNRCPYCGKMYDRDRIEIEAVKRNLKRRIKRHTNLNIKTVIILVMILAFVVVLIYLLFSNQGARQISFQTASIDSQPVLGDKEITKPSLRLYHQTVNQFNFEDGCFGRIDGGVTNTGNEPAYDVKVTCSSEGLSVEEDFGSIKPYDTKTFQLVIDYDCNKQGKEECQVSCSNC